MWKVDQLIEGQFIHKQALAVNNVCIDVKNYRSKGGESEEILTKKVEKDTFSTIIPGCHEDLRYIPQQDHGDLRYIPAKYIWFKLEI